MRVLALALLATGCGGIVGGDTDGGVDSSAPWSAVCPESRPTEGASCSHDSLDCEYGCNDVVVCSGGKWEGAVLSGQDALCDAGPNPSTCPSALSAITPNATCTNAGATCIYSQGVCECTSPADPTPDASASWFCGPEPGCPMPRPRIGSACTKASLTCDYQTCGNSVTCTDSVWQPAFAGCGG